MCVGGGGEEKGRLPCAVLRTPIARASGGMNEGVPPPSQRTSAPMVVAGAGGAIAWTCLEPGPLGLDFGLTELDEGMIGLEVKGVAAASNASSVPGLRVGMVLQQIDEFHIRATDAPNSARHAFTFARATPPQLRTSA